LNRIRPSSGVELLVKLESHNPLSSVKDRIGLSMVLDAERRGTLGPGATIVEATSGNTGIALAYVGAVRGYPVVLTMPETMSLERRRLLSAFGARLVLTPGNRGMNGAVEEAARIVAETPGAFWPRQFANQANPSTHLKATAEELLKDTGGRIGAFVAGVGTGGTVTGVGRRLKEVLSGIVIAAVEPSASAILSGQMPGPHGIQGIGAGFVPEVFDRGVIDEVIPVSEDDAIAMARRLAREEGVLAGISAGANVHAALDLAERRDSREGPVVTVICDSGERYLSTRLFDDDVH
jgi:cysteine synthase A